MYKKLLEYYLDYFHKNGEDGLKVICNCKVPSDVVMAFYNKFEPIENRPEEERKEMWLYVNELFPVKTKEEKIICSKIIYTIGNLL